MSWELEKPAAHRRGVFAYSCTYLKLSERHFDGVRVIPVAFQRYVTVECTVHSM